MTLATRMIATAQRLLTDYGQSISVSRLAGTFNASTGVLGTTSTTTFTGVGYPSNYKRRDIDGAVVREDDALLLFYSSTVPALNDVFTVGTKAMTALNIQVVSVSGSTVLYKIQLRQ